MGFSAAFPTMVGAFSKFSVSATMSVCWGNKRDPSEVSWGLMTNNSFSVKS